MSVISFKCRRLSGFSGITLGESPLDIVISFGEDITGPIVAASGGDIVCRYFRP